MESLVNKEILTDQYYRRKVFITGHTGFKGTWLSLWLQMLGATVKGYALLPETEKCIFNTTDAYKNAESIIGDIRNREKLITEIVSFQPDYIFHLAAQPLVRKSYEIPSETFDVNVTGTANLLEAVNHLQKKCTVIIVTTDKVYENKEQDILYKEEDRLGGYDPYSASKACAELVVSSFRNSFFNIEIHSTHQKYIASARAGNVIGGGDYSKDRIIPDIAEALQNHKEIIVRNPNAVRPWQHVLEPLGGYLLLASKLNNDIHYSGAYNFGPAPQDHLSVKDLVDIAVKEWGTGKWENRKADNQPHEAGLLKLDISKAKKVLNWQPKLNAQQAIEMTINWYRNAGSNTLKFTTDQINRYMEL